MRCLIAAFFQLGCAAAFADPPRHGTDAPGARALVDEPFITEYAWGVQELPMDGGKIYGWEMNDRVTFGRFKGENDQFGLSFKLNSRERLEMTTDGLRWRRSIGGSP
jgi:hypothetical protein